MDRRLPIVYYTSTYFPIHGTRFRFFWCYTEEGGRLTWDEDKLTYNEFISKYSNHHRVRLTKRLLKEFNN